MNNWQRFSPILFVRKNAAGKESSREKSQVQEQGLMAGPNCQAGWGKMAWLS
jgi:hypothetical protein